MKVLSLFVFIVMLFSRAVYAAEVVVHDPVMTKNKEGYYLFSTGPGIVFYHSTDMKNWKNQGSVFSEMPKWTQKIEGFDGHMWAPDIYFANDQYYLYYSVSAFGKNTSGIGVATNKTLDKSSSKYNWTDHGVVIESIPNRDLFNAIDPAIVQDEAGDTWMSFGSFWAGIKMVKLNENLIEIAKPQQWESTAKRERSLLISDTVAYPGAIEAPFIAKHGQYYYQFVSWDFCCRGEESTYKVVVGRSLSATGPFLDKAGVDMAQGGGSILVQGDENWYGVGHNSFYTFDGLSYLVVHAYDANDKSLPKLKILPVKWESEWPVVTQQQLVEYKSKLIE